MNCSVSVVAARIECRDRRLMSCRSPISGPTPWRSPTSPCWCGVPGQPEAVSVFTDREVEEANRYAAETGGTAVQLPLDPPSGYAVDEASGMLVPVAVAEH